MSRGISKMRRLKLRRYDDHMIELNEYFSALPGAKASGKIVEMKLNVFFNSIPNGWSKPAYAQSFIVNILLKKASNMFECMDIVESIYEGVVGPSYKNTTR